jgi:hypothetical protein
MIDRLSELWYIQLEYNKKFLKIKNNLDISNLSIDIKTKLTKDYILHAIKELSEVLDTLNFKMHRNENKKIIRHNTVEELIDTQKFLWGIFQLWNVDEKEFYSQFLRKSAVVEQRFLQEFYKLSDDKKIIILDIDGVISDYPKCFIDYINKKNNSNFKTIYDLKNNLSQQQIYDFKDDYRNSGIKSILPLKEGIIEFIDKIKEKYHIVLLSSRPYSKYFRIYADTLEWLEKNKIHYDAIYWDEKKDRNILHNLDLNQIAFVIEDNLYFANKISQLGISVYLMNNEYNQNKELNLVKRINNLGEIQI